MKKILMKNQLLQKKFESGYQDSYFTSDIYYIDVTDALNDKNTSEGNSLVGSNSTSLKSTYELTEWVKNHNISEEQIYTLQTDNGYYVFTVYEEPQNYDYWDDAESDENDSPVYLMYILVSTVEILGIKAISPYSIIPVHSFSLIFCYILYILQNIFIA